MPSLSVPILTYHAIEHGPAPLFIAPDVFESHLAALAQADYQAVSLTAVLDWLQQGTPLPPRPVVITFDDGYASVYEHAWPRLQAFGFTALVFLISDYCGRDNQWPGQARDLPVRPLLTWAQVEQMAAAGCTFGAHTRTHPSLPSLDPAACEAEITGAIQPILQHTGQRPETFAYPYGIWNERVAAVVQQHFAGAVSTRLALAGRRDNPYDLPRIDAYYLTPSLILQLDRPLFRLYLAIRRMLRTVRRGFRPDGGQVSLGARTV